MRIYWNLQKMQRAEKTFSHPRNWRRSEDGERMEPASDSGSDSEPEDALTRETDGTRRYKYAAHAQVDADAGRVTYTTGGGKRYVERCTLLSKSDAMGAIAWILGTDDGPYVLDGVWLATEDPVLFWSLRVHWPSQCVEDTLTQTFGVRKKRRRTRVPQRLTVDEFSDE